MSIELKRTVSHFHRDGSESLIELSVITFDDGSRAIRLAPENGENSILVHSSRQLEDLVNVLGSVGAEVFDQ